MEDVRRQSHRSDSLSPSGRQVVLRTDRWKSCGCASRSLFGSKLLSHTTPRFLIAFSHFCSRRGLPSSVYSDNGTTFVGADYKLTSAFRTALRDPDFLNSVATDQVSWRFLSPSAPHFGEIWKAGVKSVKYHLCHIHTVMFEEFSTLLYNIEACLNSRPIAPLSDSFNDYNCLTPEHLLVVSAITTALEPSLLELIENRLSR